MHRPRAEKITRRLLVCALVAGNLSPLGCGGGEGAVAPVPLAELQARITAAACDLNVRCGLFADEASCEQATSSQLQVFADVDAGKTQYDGEAAARCLAGVAALGCSYSGQASLPAVRRQCAGMFKGTVPNGGACLGGQECVSQSCNTGACNGLACCAGVCQAEVLAGGDCRPTGSVCAEGLFCHFVSSGSGDVCAPLVAAGQMCNPGDQCVPGVACLADQMNGTPGPCAPPPVEGEPCPVGVCDSPWTSVTRPARYACPAPPSGRPAARAPSASPTRGAMRTPASASPCRA